MPVSPRVFFGLNEISDYLNESPNTVRDWVQRRKIPFYKRGKRLQFNLEEIKTWDKKRNYIASEN